MSNESREPANDQESATCVGEMAVAVKFVGAGGVTVIAAWPLAVPAQFASLTALTVYVVVPTGETLRSAEVPVVIVCATLSGDQVTVHGAVPVSVARIVVLAPWLIVELPITDTAAVTKIFVRTRDPEPLDPQPAVTVTFRLTVVPVQLARKLMLFVP
jgi:hypothetical protein